MNSRELSQSRSQTESKVSSFLFHLGKGLWKSVPVLGPIVEEVVYEQFKDKLEGRVSQLSDEDLDRLSSALPVVSPETLSSELEHLSNETKLFALEQFGLLMQCIQREKSELVKHVEEIQTKSDLLPSILDIVLTLSDKTNNEGALRLALNEIERRRVAWINRISKHQKLLLSKIPETYTHVDEIWPVCQNALPECTYKEFRFRLHEFEWLSLVERTGKPGNWRYRVTQEGKETVANAAA